MCESIVPAVFVQRSVFYRTYRVLPLISAFEICSFNDTSAWESEHTRFHVVESLCEILAHAVFVSLPCVFREKTHVFQIYIASAGVHDSECSAFNCLVGFEHELIFFPLFGVDLESLLGELLAFIHRMRVAERYTHACFLAVRNSCPHTEAVLFAVLVSYSEESFVLQT